MATAFRDVQRGIKTRTVRPVPKVQRLARQMDLMPLVRMDGRWFFDESYDEKALAQEYGDDALTTQGTQTAITTARIKLQELLKRTDKDNIARPSTYYAVVYADPVRRFHESLAASQVHRDGGAGMRLFIEPLDVLFFRDGNPFVAGESHVAQSLFPPTALTFQGAIRSAILAGSDISLERFLMGQSATQQPGVQALMDEIGHSSSFGRLRLRGPFVASAPKNASDLGSVEEWYPCAADVMARRKEATGPAVRLRPLEQPAWIGDLSEGIAPVWAATSERVEAARGWTARSGWRAPRRHL